MKEFQPLICPECGVEFTPKHHLQVFCGSAHQAAFHQRSATRGKVLLPLALSYRRGKNGKSGDSTYAFAEMCALLDLWNREDREAGRRPDIVVTNKRKAGWKGVDHGD